MDYGFKAANNDNVLQIDNTFKNFRFREKRTVVTNVAYSSTNSSYTAASFTISGTARPVVAHRNTFATSVIGPYPSGSNYQCLIAVNRAMGQSFPIWIFDDSPPANTPGSYGMIVKNASSQRIFNSQNEWLKPTSIVLGTASFGGVDSFVLPDAASLGIVQLQKPYRLVYIPLPVPPFPARYNLNHADYMHWRVSETLARGEYRTDITTTGPYEGGNPGFTKDQYGFLGVDLSRVL